MNIWLETASNDFDYQLSTFFNMTGLKIDRSTVVLFASAAAVRLLLFTAFPGLPATLTGRLEISTPVTSFKRCELRLPS